MSGRSVTLAGRSSTTRAVRPPKRQLAPTRSRPSIVESVPEGADAERVLTQMALDGANIIFTTSFGYMDATINVAAKFPDVKFEHATGYKRADNVATYNARFYEGRAVIGHIAGKMTKTNKIGYIALLPDPGSHHGHQLGLSPCQEGQPRCRVQDRLGLHLVRPGRKRPTRANALIEQGCDVIMQHTDSTAAVAVAEEKGI